MRRLLAIAAFVLLPAVSVWAQHGGGHGGGFGGGHGGGGHFSSGGMHAGSGGAHGFGHGPSMGSRGFAGHGFANRGFSGRSFSGRSFSGRSFNGRGFSGRGFNRSFHHDRFRGGRFHTFGFRNNCFGYGCGYYGYPWAYSGLYDPYWWWDTGSSYDEDYQQNLAQAAEMNRESLEEQRMMRQEEADRDQDSYAQEAPAPRVAESDAPKGVAMMPNTVLVFRDQHKEEISNYAIVGHTLWNFSPGRTQKIPLADLDVPATTKANEDLGVTFRVPGMGEAQ